MGDTTYYRPDEMPESVQKYFRKSSLDMLEFKLIPRYLGQLGKDTDSFGKLYDLSAWKKDIEEMTFTAQYIIWEDFSCEIRGNVETECVIVYEFPTPFEVPLAKFGAVYVNKQKRIAGYYTLELSYNGYMMCSATQDRHFVIGKRGDMSKEEFVKEVCEALEIDGTLLEKKKVVKM